jgi:hypothetical protein
MSTYLKVAVLLLVLVAASLLLGTEPWGPI